MKYIAFLSCCLCAIVANGQPATRFFYEDTNYGRHADYAYSHPILTLSDGGHLLRFERYASRDYDLTGGIITNIKIDSNFNPQWQDSIQVIGTFQGKLLSTSMTGSSKFAVHLQDADATVNWSSIFDMGSDIIVPYEAITVGGRIKVLCRHTHFDTTGFGGGFSIATYALLVELDSTGTVVSADTFVYGTRDVHIYSGTGNDYYVVQKKIGGNASNLISHLNADNSVIWSRNITFSGNGNYITGGLATSSGFVMAGNIFSISPLGLYSSDMFICKLSSAGNIAWQKVSDRKESGAQMALLADGNIGIYSGGAGFYMWSAPGINDFMKMDTSGNVLMCRSMQPNLVSWPYYKAMSAPYTGRDNSLYFAAVAVTPFAPMILHTDSVADDNCRSVAVPMHLQDSVMFTSITDTVRLNNFPIVNSITTMVLPIRAVAYDDGCDYHWPVGVNEEKQPVQCFIYPNPTSGITTLEVLASNLPCTLTITDLLGRCMQATVVNSQNVTVDCNYSPGTYILTLRSSSGIQVQKLVVEN
ncbi:hypothetical protein CJD36_002870 [Flavipsychrobacter stenotrophus]|uniref:Secretion system C-terminal sorting domain-containing protein n=1 Tax=Flavipsychrobacter stenotrophus TaxID=2077091 RepID=A0A2S7T162_9BACT|nr:T9SS type A sorting domain-containing protein [Flavipsychrobacter stenotrophus]PQJ12704.1 hypothetical protein CJD36_002870 [Flavipsychrobacter stenotrophus]